jgi:hypothetical protein
MRTHCKNGHPLTPANSYKTQEGSIVCRTCQRERKRRPGTKIYSTYYTKMREAEIAAEQPPPPPPTQEELAEEAAAQEEHDRRRAESRRQRESFEEFFGKIGEIYKEKAWMTRFGIFVLGWKEAEERHAKVSNRPGVPEALVDKKPETPSGARPAVCY